VTYEQVQPIRPFVQYLALGHVHIRFDREGWLFNPGSLETCSVDEVGEDRGFYLVDVDTERAPAIQATLLTPRRRPFLRFRVDAGQARTPGELEALVQAAVRPHIDSTGTISDPGGWSAGSARDPTGEWNKPVVDLCLRGTLRFDRKDLDLNALEMIASRALNALHVEVKNQAVPRDFQSNDGGPVSRQELERRTLEALFMNDTRYQPDAGHWAEVAAEIKRMAVSGAEPETLAQFLEQSLPVGHE
jgi:DNA repair exonuclease SbcCD nuclease subunit